MRPFLKGIYQQQINARLELCGDVELDRTAIVFAPHQDDETLGCGGTILRKTNRHVPVKIVFMTDGSTSHSHLMPAAELTCIRTQEAVAASKSLGVAEADVSFLNFQDGQLAESFDAAVARVREIVLDSQPQQVFVPYVREPVRDHVATNQIVRAALTATHSAATIYEYPIWAWYHWPWVDIPWAEHRNTRNTLKSSLRFALGLRLLNTFDAGVYIGDLLAQKLQALAQHRSQMSQLLPDKGWLTLYDVGNGEWLKCFFQDYELFRRTSR